MVRSIPFNNLFARRAPDGGSFGHVFKGHAQVLDMVRDADEIGVEVYGHDPPGLRTVSIVACLIFARWRQENFFKYSREHHGLDDLLGYAWDEADGTRLVPNPERKQVERELAAGPS